MKDKEAVNKIFDELKSLITSEYELKIINECHEKLNNLIDLTDEQWRDVVGYENLYQVSNKGRIKSFHNGKETILVPQGAVGDYLKISLCKNQKIKIVDMQILVARAFIDNPDNKPVVHHRDNNRHNNCVENLEWVDYSENLRYAYITGTRKRFLTGDTVRYIRKNYVPRHPEFGIRALAKKFNVKEGIVSQVVHRVTYCEID